MGFDGEPNERLIVVPHFPENPESIVTLDAWRIFGSELLPKDSWLSSGIPYASYKLMGNAAK